MSKVSPNSKGQNFIVQGLNMTSDQSLIDHHARHTWNNPGKSGQNTNLADKHFKVFEIC